MFVHSGGDRLEGCDKNGHCSREGTMVSSVEEILTGGAGNAQAESSPAIGLLVRGKRSLDCDPTSEGR